MRGETWRAAGLILTIGAVGAIGGSALARQTATQPAPAAAQAPTAPLAPIPRPVQPQPGPITPAPRPATPVATPVAEPEASTKPPAAKVETPKPAATATTPKPVEPTKRGRSSVAIIQALDKVTTETMRFEAPVGQPIRYKTLIFTVRACETTAADEVAPDSAAYLTVDTQPKALPGRVAPQGRQVYKGWMYASSPGLNPLQHPVYDAWLIACKASSPVAPAAKR